jgi:hypothetical protein
MQSGDLRRGGGHLPPGHEPGPQSKRMKRGRPIGVAIIVLAMLGLAAAAVLLLVTAKHAKSPSGAHVGAAILGGAALSMLLLLLYVVRRLRPRQADYLELRVEPIEVRRGDTVAATLTISDAAKLAEKLELGLVCTEYYDQKQTVYTQNGSNEQRATRSTDAFSKWANPDRRQLQQTVRFTVPPEAPFSYEGGTVSWAWHVSVLDRQTHRTDAHRNVPIWVSP